MSQSSGVHSSTSRERFFGGLAGLILAVTLLKYGNPVIFSEASWISAFEDLPAQRNVSLIEWLLGPWPVTWVYWTIVGLCLSVVLTRCSWRSCTSTWLIALPLIWLGWQLAATARTLSPELSKPVLGHFLFSVLWFYLGVFGMAVLRRPGSFFGPLVVGFSLVIAVGWHQHWIGLEETRRYFYELPNWRDFPPTFLAKLGSDRIYATLFYPNALAGAILLLLPVSLAWIWRWTELWEFNARVFLAGLFAAVSLACLYWSQSKAGWLILLAMGGLVFLHCPFPWRVKVAVATLVVVIGLAGFFARYSHYFSGGATSLVARFDYWRAAVDAVRSNPLLGTGPGTFMIHYSKVKPPEAEMARLVHNDYLQQASDSGVPAALLYLVFVVGALWWLYRQHAIRHSLLHFATWLGLFGFSVQSFVEFGLYIPALAWPFFFLLGWLLANPRSDTLRPHESPVPQRA